MVVRLVADRPTITNFTGEGLLPIGSLAEGANSSHEALWESPRSQSTEDSVESQFISMGPPVSLLQTSPEASLRTTRHGHLVQDHSSERDLSLEADRLEEEASRISEAFMQRPTKFNPMALVEGGMVSVPDSRLRDKPHHSEGRRAARGTEYDAHRAGPTALSPDDVLEVDDFDSGGQSEEPEQVPQVDQALKDLILAKAHHIPTKSSAEMAAENHELDKERESDERLDHSEESASAAEADRRDAQQIHQSRNMDDDWHHYRDHSYFDDGWKSAADLESDRQDGLQVQQSKTMDDGWHHYRDHPYVDTGTGSEAGRPDVQQASPSRQAGIFAATQPSRAWKSEDARAYYFGNHHGDVGAASRHVRPRETEVVRLQKAQREDEEQQRRLQQMQQKLLKEAAQKKIEQQELREQRRLQQQLQRQHQQEHHRGQHHRHWHQQLQQPQHHYQEQQQQEEDTSFKQELLPQLQQPQQHEEQYQQQEQEQQQRQQRQQVQHQQQQRQTAIVDGIGGQGHVSMEEATYTSAGSLGREFAKMAEDMRAAKKEEEDLRALVQVAAGTPGARARRPLVALAVAGFAVFAVAAVASVRLIKIRSSALEYVTEVQSPAANSASVAAGGRGENTTPMWTVVRISAFSLMSAVPTLTAFLRQHALQVLCLSWVFLTAAQTAFLIPFSHGVLVAEYSLISSSWFTSICFTMSVFSTLGARHLMKPWNEHRNRVLVLVVASLQPGLAILYMFLVDQASPIRFGSHYRQLAMMFIRLAFSASVGFSMLVVFMAQRVMPADGLVLFGMQRAGATILGTGFGIFMAAFGPAIAISAGGARAVVVNGYYRFLLLWLSALWVALTSALAVLFSKDAGSMLSGKAAAEASSLSSDVGKAFTDFIKAGGTETLEVMAQRKLWLWSCLVACQRGLVTSGLEVLMISIWTARFMFEPADAGLSLGACFLLGAFLAPLAIALAHRGGTAAEVEVLGILAGLCVCASLLLFGPCGGAFASDGGAWLTFLAGTLVLPSSFLMAGTVEGLAMSHAIADSAYDQENLLTLSTIFQEFSVHLLGPGMMHGLLALGGQIVCASANLGVILVLPAIAYSSRSTLYAIRGKGAIREGSEVAEAGAAAGGGGGEAPGCTRSSGDSSREHEA